MRPNAIRVEDGYLALTDIEIGELVVIQDSTVKVKSSTSNLEDGKTFYFPKWIWDLIGDGDKHTIQGEWTGTFWRIYIDGKAVGDTAMGQYKSSEKEEIEA